MAYEVSPYGTKITLVAGADLSALQYYFVKINSSGQAIACAAATDQPIGILQNAPIANQEAEILVAGGSKLVLGGTVTIGQVVSPSSAGAGVAIANGTDTTKYGCGIALAGGASGETITAVVSLASAGRGA